MEFSKTSFENCTFEQTRFHISDLSGLRLDGQTFIGTIFDMSELKETSFKGPFLEMFLSKMRM